MEVAGEEVSEGEPVHRLAVAAVVHGDGLGAEAGEEAVRPPLAPEVLVHLADHHGLAAAPPRAEVARLGG